MAAQTDPPSIPDILRALGDPVRWAMIRQLAGVGELACGRLEETLPISKSTISHHARILVRAGLVSVRRQGRHHFYTLRRDTLRKLIRDLEDVASVPMPSATAGGADTDLPTW